ncbi:MAG: SGNH/GDSL hydrolase family protein [Nocardioidaceae bacterium]
MRTVRLTAALAVLVLLASACTSGGSPVADTVVPTPPTGRYVALGDSYSAGPLIPNTDLAGGCARSDHNYPSLVAKTLKVKTFVDVTCSGATTLDLAHVQRPFGDARIPPQLRSVTADTTLVTLGIGGNDFDLFSTLVRTCTRLRASDPQGSPCARKLATTGGLAPPLRKITTRVAASLRAIKAKAPRATVVLVGYLRLVPDSGSCPGLPLARGDYAEGRTLSQGLDRALKRAARRTGTTFVDMYSLSRGHDICSSAPWVNGSVSNRQRALAYHPFASGMRADAAAVLAALPSAD